MDNKSDMIQVATLGKAQGIKGEMKINLIGGDADKFARYEKIIVGDKEFAVESFKTLTNGNFIKLKGVNDRNTAEKLTNSNVYVNKNLVPRDDDEYFIADLIGCSVFVDGKNLGVLSDVLQTGAADVYVVKGDKPFMFPALKKVLKKIDIINRIIELDDNIFNEIVLYED